MRCWPKRGLLLAKQVIDGICLLALGEAGDVSEEGNEEEGKAD